MVSSVAVTVWSIATVDVQVGDGPDVQEEPEIGLIEKVESLVASQWLE